MKPMSRMNKKILIGSIIAVVILLLMPSIPAVHLNSIQNEINQVNDVISEQPIYDIKGFPEIPGHFPLLFLFVIGIAYFRFARVLLWLEYSLEIDNNWPGNINIIHPLGALRAAILLCNTEWWLIIWEVLSNRLGWDWSFI